MNKKGFAISVVLYSMVILVIGIFYLLLGIVRNRYMIEDVLKGTIINTISDIFSVTPSKKIIDVIETLPMTEADNNGTMFVYGENVENNYVWYSGKLWRIVSIDEDGSIKLVTQGNMTSITWNTIDSADYSTSQMRSWLNNEFLPTLYDAENLLVDHEWDYTAYKSFPTQKADENITKLTGENAEKVGLLNIYEYMMTGGTADSSTSKTFLNNGYRWWVISPYNGTNVWRVFNDGSVEYNTPTNNSYSVRPSINMKSGVTILDGTGEKDDPYIIRGDKKTGTSSELLSNRISGEYIYFNNIKYRIVGIETIDGQKLTKVTMADYDVNKNALKTSQAFGTSNSAVTYTTSSGIGKYLYEWYNGTSINNTYKNMIETEGVIWYVGSTTGVGYDYTLSKTGTNVSTPIGLGYYGEMFSSHFGDSDLSSNTWLMTKHNSYNIWYANHYGHAYTSAPTNGYGVRPSFYLKSDVKILKGTGMLDTPYELIM